MPMGSSLMYGCIDSMHTIDSSGALDWALGVKAVDQDGSIAYSYTHII